MQDILIPYSEAQRERFRSGPLRDEWASRYPDIFDMQDVEICRNQPNYHFFEWLASVVIFEATGYLSLVEKYETAKHRRKVEIFRSFVDPIVYANVMADHSSVPDIFSYDLASGDWMFCEVKGRGDRLSSAQKMRIGELEEISQRRVLLARFQLAGRS